MSDKFELSDFLTEEDKKKLTPEQAKCFAINEDIFRLHREFKAKVAEATNLAALDDLFNEYVGPDPDEIEGKFGELLLRIEAVTNTAAFFILASVFEEHQTAASRAYEARFNALLEPAKPAPKREWN